MPITQARMLTVLAALREYHEAFQSLHDGVRDVVLTKPEEQWRALLWERLKLLPSREAFEVLTKEVEHYRLVAAHNDRNRLRLRHKQGYKGTMSEPPRPTLPPIIHAPQPTPLVAANTTEHIEALLRKLDATEQRPDDADL